MRQPLIAGNWKMHTSPREGVVLAHALREALAGLTVPQVAVFPPALSLPGVAEALAGSNVGVGAQDLHWEPQGAFTGAISAEMIAATGAAWVLVGHSERRQFFGETDETVQRKIRAGLRAGLNVIVCVGETLRERERDETWFVLERQTLGAIAGLTADQLPSICLAYEPVWAIGTGKVASPDQAQEVHAFLRNVLARRLGDAPAQALRLLYGGSVKADNAQALLQRPDVDGALVGGASLDAASFAAIAAAV